MMHKYGTDYDIECPFCKTKMNALNIIQKKTLLRCPNISTPEQVKEHYGIDNWKYSGKCGRMFYLLI